ncbi:unnamed protein product [Dovyalis caffra]|uniref:Uncharacterized protein n=1 Tax=Dovyalis caffra TaxID=77055 RepID=A0AAV1S9I4_9ROSI|nr:unnamed protein product [Dovyalis caffra]
MDILRGCSDVFSSYRLNAAAWASGFSYQFREQLFQAAIDTPVKLPINFFKNRGRLMEVWKTIMWWFQPLFGRKVKDITGS